MKQIIQRKPGAAIARLIRELPHQRCPWHGANCSHGHAHAHGKPADTDYAFEMAASNIRFGAGVTREVGHDFVALGAKRVMVFSDKNIASLRGGPLDKALAALTAAKVPHHTVFTDVTIEPTDASFQRAIAAAKAYNPDAFLAVGGGSVMDTAKAANLYLSHPTADFLDFVNAPVGKGLPVPGPVKPLIAVPTTAGTGSETTGVAIFDYTPLHAKTGIANRMLKPHLGVVDPDNTLTMPPAVAAASGFDVLCHALESYTAIPYDERSPRPATPQVRPAYQGANPVSDVWSTYALRLLSRYFVRAVKDRLDEEANAAMTLAATYAGIGFGNAGVHLAHGMSYGISGLNKTYFHPSYPGDKPLVPHGVAVVMSAPAIFRRTAAVSPGRHLEAAALLRGDNPPVSVAMYRGVGGEGTDKRATSEEQAADAGKRLAEQLQRYMDVLSIPDGLTALGYTEADIPALVEATLPQRRVLNLAPSHSSAEELAELFRASMKVY